MGYRRLPAYGPGFRVTPNNAKQDKIALTLGDWFLGPDSYEAYSHFFLALAPPAANSLNSRPTEDAPHTQWFTRDTPHLNGTFPELRVRQGGRGRGMGTVAPLFQGKLKTRGAPASAMANRQSARQFSLTLNLNPTRFVHHQILAPWVSQRTLPVDEWALPSPSLRKNEPKLIDMDERSLDDNDNVLMGRAAMEFTRSERWSLSVSRYWFGMLRELEETFNSAATSAAVPIAWRPSVNLRVVETYWECRVDDPLAWMIEIEPILASLGITAAARNYPFPDGFSTIERQTNSRSISVRLCSGVILRVYAKTTKRIRFEIVHDLIENARPIGGRHTSKETSSLIGWIGHLAEDAAIQMNRVLQILEDARVRPSDAASVTELIVTVSQIIGEAELALQIMTILATNQSISVGDNSCFRDAVQKLKRRGILATEQSHRRTYRLTARYSDAGLRLGAALK